MIPSEPFISPDAQGILECITDAFFALDTDWRFTYINRQAENVWERTRQELLGKNIWGVFPEAVGSLFDQRFRHAVAQETAAFFEEFYPTLDAWLEVRAYPSPQGLSVFFQKVSERRRVQDVLRVSEEALRTSDAQLQDTQARLEAALSAGGIATWTWDLSTDLLVVDAYFAHLFSVSSEYAAGGASAAYFQAIHPDDRARVAQAIADAVAGQDSYEAEYRVVMPDGAHRWLSARGRVERDAAGQAIGLPGAVLDVTERAERRLRERFLANLAERARGMTDPDAVIANAVNSVGRFLEVSRCTYADIDIQADTCSVHLDYRADDTVTSMAGAFPISQFGSFLTHELQAGQPVTADDVRAEPDHYPPEILAAYETVDIRSFAAVPVLHSSLLVSCLACHSSIPRRWTPEDIQLMQSVVERTWLTVAVLRQQRILAQEAEEQRLANERIAAILASITDAFFALDTDWNFTYLNDRAERLLRSRTSLLGRNVWEEFPAAVGTAFDREYHRAVSEQAVVAFEEYYPQPLDTWFEVRAYPSPQGLSVYFQDITERKALEAERRRLAEREHNIAQQLQEALQPELPGVVPGLAVTRYYEAALAEAGVGGDFYDVFALEKGITALVVGDLSGKGLAAASQVATVRNMLRYAVLRAETLAEGVTELNGVLAEWGLLTGFATLFIGAYNSGTRVLTYVNCGQEPALIRRAAGGVEEMRPTGPILGSIEGAAFSEEIVHLGTGDAVAIFSDGLTEVGKSRTEMIGIEGVTALLAGAVFPAETEKAEAVAEHLALCLIEGVDTAAKDGVMRDDVCLLIGVVE